MALCTLVLTAWLLHFGTLVGWALNVANPVWRSHDFESGHGVRIHEIRQIPQKFLHKNNKLIN